MKPVTQTITGPTGNCMGACLASILEVSIETVPNFFDAGPDDTDWWNALRAWLRKFGLGIVTLTFESPAQWMHLRLAGYHIVSGPSPRLEGMHHATVWHAGKMVHDPHPDGTGIVKPETLDMLYLIEPASLQLPASVIAAQLRAPGVDVPAKRPGWMWESFAKFLREHKGYTEEQITAECIANGLTPPAAGVVASDGSQP